MKTKLLLVLCFVGSMVKAQYGAYLPPQLGTGYQSSGPPPPPTGTTPLIRTDAGNGTNSYSGDGGQASVAELSYPCDVKFDASGNLYIADSGNDRIRKVITSTGIMSTVAGNGTAGFSGDGGQATAAELDNAKGLMFDASGNLYIVDSGNNRIRKITTAGIISTIAGTGTAGYSGDGGQATAAKLNDPFNMAFDASGNLYIADWLNSVIRKIATTGIISTFAGNGTFGYRGDGGQATAAEFRYPTGITFDVSGNLYIADEENEVIRMVNTSGIISTIAGNYVDGFGYTGDGGAATAATLYYPSDVKFDASGNLYIADYYNQVIRMVDVEGTISTFAGNHTAGFSGDCGQCASAELQHPENIAIDAKGNVFISDQDNFRIREVMPICTANAGPNGIDAQNCCGWPGVTVGTVSLTCLSYSWTPANSHLSSYTIAQPTSTWTNTSIAEIYTLTVSNSNGYCTTSTSTVQISATSCGCSGCCRLAAPSTDGFSSIALPTNFSVYPNPSKSSITIGLYDLAEYIRIIDMQGRTVFEKQNTDAGEFKLDISQYNKGIYFVMAKIGNTLEKQKLVVE